MILLDYCEAGRKLFNLLVLWRVYQRLLSKRMLRLYMLEERYMSLKKCCEDKNRKVVWFSTEIWYGFLPVYTHKQIQNASFVKVPIFARLSLYWRIFDFQIKPESLIFGKNWVCYD
jgi:hypothetical protein